MFYSQIDNFQLELPHNSEPESKQLHFSKYHIIALMTRQKSIK
jgi:hypothetical protein